jgi:dihydropyrimidine dehydrogenase (NAD+) subunit PreT
LISQRATARTLSRSLRLSGFEEVEQPLTLPQAMFEANRCLFCYDAPCIQGCPAGIDIPQFIARIRSRNFTGSAEAIYKDNPLGAICGRVCPVEALCEKACTSRLLNVPIAIGNLQRFVCDQALAADSPKEFPAYRDPDQGKGTIAIIGGGPAGLSCAHYLRLLGYQVDLFEREECPGGLLRWAIPPYRLPWATVESETQLISRRVTLKRKEILAADAEQLLAEYDAIFLGLGLGQPVSLGIPGETLPGVFYGASFLRTLRQGNKESFSFEGKEIAVIGGGATAMDAARSALRLGASRVTVIYRRTAEEMPAFHSEYLAALEEGVDFLWLSALMEIRSEDGRLHLQLERMSLGNPDSSGRASPVPTGARFTMTVDSVLVAIASRPEMKSTEGWGDHPKVFRGGDLSGGATVVQAVADGKAAAKKIAAWLENGGMR